jgi:hypothetical protein
MTQVVYFTHDSGMKEIGERLGVRVVELQGGGGGKVDIPQPTFVRMLMVEKSGTLTSR